VPWPAPCSDRVGDALLTLDDVAALALALPQAQEQDRRGNRAWSVGTKVFAWERPFSKADLKRFGEAPVPDGPVVAVRTADLGEKEAVLAAGDPAVFTIPHFDGYPAVLIERRRASKKAVRDALVDAWLASAPPKLAEAFAADLGTASG
jgi:hypothetical protein